MRHRIALFKICCVAVLCMSIVGARAQDAGRAAAAARAEKFEQLNAEKADRGDDQIRVNTDSSGYMNALISPAGKGFKVPGVNQADPQAVAAGFLARWADLLHNPSAQIGHKQVRSIQANGVTIVRLNETWHGIDVYKAQATVQVDKNGLVRHLANGFVTDTADLDSGKIKLQPTIDAAAAAAAATAFEIEIYKVLDPAKVTATPPQLVVFGPAVVGAKGPLALCWMTVVSGSGKPACADEILVDAHSGKVLYNNPLVHDYEYIEIYDMTGYWPWDFGELRRTSDDPAYGDGQIDLALYLADYIYWFYYNLNGRDSYDNTGGTIGISTYLNDDNAYWHPSYNHIWVGTGFNVDDVLMHELTHGVTQYESGLVYSGESGALNESFSDMWGEWFDLTYNFVNVYYYTNNDSSAARWLCAEDCSIGTLRDMEDPNAYYCPAFYKGSYWDPYEEVHTNSGVGNKLAFLLTDGSTFNGFSISGLGINGAETLMYGVQCAITNTSLAYYGLYSQIISSANNLGYTASQLLNVEKACQAVGIRNNTGSGLKILNDSSVATALIDDSGCVKLHRGLSQNQSNINTNNNGWSVKNDSGEVVAYIDTSASNDGAMYIKGTITEHTVPGESSSYVWVLRYEGVPVAAIDGSGNLKIWGTLYLNQTTI